MPEFLRRSPLVLFVALLPCLAPQTASAQDFVRANSLDIEGHVGFATGVSWADWDGDGDLDLYVTTGFSGNRNNVLYRNDAGTFVRVTGVPLATDNADTPCSAWADYDDDGDLDVFVSNLGTGNGVLYANQGGGVFAPAAAGLPATLKGAGCAWGDYDRDGHVDLVIACIFGQLGMTTANRLFHNEGNGTFTLVTSAPIGTVTDTHHHPTWSDFDGDGDLDLFFATGNVGSTDTDRMYRNQLVETGTATFTAMTTESFATDPRDSQTLQWIDYDNDGDFDLFAVNYTSVPCQLYRNDGGGAFTKITSGDLVTDLGNAHGATWGDFDDDGDLDVYVVTDLQQVNRYYRNEGDGAFTRILTGAFVTDALSNYGVAAGDYDRDGDLDLFVPTARSEAPSILYRNDLATGAHWLELTLRGTASNRSAIGTKVSVRAIIGGAPRWQLRELRSGTGYGGHDALEIHFGLGDALFADSVWIEWPSGIRQVLTGIAADQRVNVIEDLTTDVLASLVSTQVSSEQVELVWEVGGDAGTSVGVERSSESGAWRSLATLVVDGSHRVSLVDRDVQPGARYRYRLRLDTPAGERAMGETEVAVPSMSLALTIQSGASIRARIQIPTAADVSVDLFDERGRRRLARVRQRMTAGTHDVELAAASALPPGAYWVRLSHPAGIRTASAFVVR